MTAAPSPTPTARRLALQLGALRPRQWLKNLLVLAAPLGAGVLAEPSVLRAATLAVVSFSLAASAGYLLNDVRDVPIDRAHPQKRHRAVASGALTPRAALTAAAGLVAVALGVAFAVRLELGLTVLAYLVVSGAYSCWLKHWSVLELVTLSLGFLLRAVAGGAATGVPLSRWFLLVAATGSLFMAAGKRTSELRRLDGHATPLEQGSSGRTRRSLAGYSAAGLRATWVAALSVAVVAYALWAVDVGDRDGSLPWAALSVVPFAAGALRYAWHVQRGDAEAPELTVLADRTLQVVAAVWLLLFWLGARGV